MPVEAAQSLAAHAGPGAMRHTTSVRSTPADLVQRLVSLEDDSERWSLLEGSLAAGDVEQVLTLLRAEAERQAQVDPHVTLRAAELLIRAASLAGRPYHEALGMMTKADALRYLGRYPESLPCFERAAEAYLRQGDEVGWARTRIGWLHTMLQLGRAGEALPVVERAREILVRHDEWLRAGGMDLNAGWVNQELGNYERALQLYDRAQAAYDVAGDAGAVRAAYAKANRAILLTLLGDFPAALALHREAREFWVGRGETTAVVHQDHNIAYVYLGQGHYTRALQLLTEVAAAREAAGLEVEVARAKLNMVECYLGLNRDVDALGLALEAVDRFERCGTPTEAAKARLYASLAHSRMGNVEEALALLGDAAETFASAGLSTQRGLATLQRARLHLGEGDWTASLQQAREAHAVFAGQGVAVRLAEAELVEARASLELEGHAEASALARAALELGEDRGVPWLTYEGYHVLSRLAQAQGNLPAALAACDRAIAGIERVQSRLATELRSNFLDDKLQVYWDAIDYALCLAAPDLGFAYLERAKSRALVDYLAANTEVRLRARRTTSQVLLDELTRLREEHNWFYNRLYGYELAQPGHETPKEAETHRLEEAVRDRERRISRLLERLALQEADGLEGVALPEAAAPTPPHLDTGTVLLEYYLRRDSGAVFVIADGRIEVVPLAAGSEAIQRLLYQWQLNLEATARSVQRGDKVGGLGRNACGMLRALHRALLQPAERLLAGRERLVVVPYGPTHAVPWQALFDGERFLLETVEVATCPSSALLQLCAGRQPRVGHGALVMANSDGGRLPYVLREAGAVAALVPGTCYVQGQATRQALIKAAPTHVALHLAAHGEARLDNPTFAHLKLADGQLSTSDVFNLELDGALVTLSACETGRSVVTGGDELIGLSRGFLYAGASTLVQSLWRVEDSSTAQLMERFYRGVKEGHTVGQALRAAQRALLVEHGDHPYFWAPFQIVGNSNWRWSPPQDADGDTP